MHVVGLTRNCAYLVGRMPGAVMPVVQDRTGGWESVGLEDMEEVDGEVWGGELHGDTHPCVCTTPLQTERVCKDLSYPNEHFQPGSRGRYLLRTDFPPGKFGFFFSLKFSDAGTSVHTALLSTFT